MRRGGTLNGPISTLTNTGGQKDATEEAPHLFRSLFAGSHQGFSSKRSNDIELNTSKDIETENSTGVVTNRLKRGPGRPPKYTDVDTSLPMEEIRQARRRFANRESARRLRKRKIEASAAQMEEIEYLNNKIDDLEAENEELKALLAVNEMENQKLKELLGNKD